MCHNEFGHGTEYCLLAVAPPGHLSAKFTGPIHIDLTASLARHHVTEYAINLKELILQLVEVIS